MVRSPIALRSPIILPLPFLTWAGVALDLGDVQGYGQRWGWGRVGGRRAFHLLEIAMPGLNLRAAAGGFLLLLLTAPHLPTLIGGYLVCRSLSDGNFLSYPALIWPSLVLPEHGVNY